MHKLLFSIILLITIGYSKQISPTTAEILFQMYQSNPVDREPIEGYEDPFPDEITMEMIEENLDFYLWFKIWDRNDPLRRDFSVSLLDYSKKYREYRDVGHEFGYFNLGSGGYSHDSNEPEHMATLHTIHMVINHIIDIYSIAELEEWGPEIVARVNNGPWRYKRGFTTDDKVTLLALATSDPLHRDRIRRRHRFCPQRWVSARLGDTRAENQIITAFHNSDTYDQALEYAEKLSRINSKQSIVALCYGLESSLDNRKNEIDEPSELSLVEELKKRMLEICEQDQEGCKQNSKIYEQVYINDTICTSLRSSLISILDRNLIEYEGFEEFRASLTFPQDDTEALNEDLLLYQEWVNRTLDIDVDIPSSELYLHTVPEE